jgi:hypothetical protein
MACADIPSHRIPGAAVKVQTPEFAAILTPELMQIASCLESHGHELRLVGGVVRDLLMGKMPKDVDLATPATPDQVRGPPCCAESEW